MRLKQYTKWQMNTGLKTIATGLAIIVGFQILFAFLIGVTSNRYGVQGGIISGTSNIIGVFMFVIGIIYFSMSLRTGLANSTSRKTIFCGLLVTSVILTGVLAVVSMLVDTVVNLILSLILKRDLVIMVMPLFDGKGPSGFLGVMLSLLFNWCITFLLMAIGLFIGGAYYRMNRMTKILVSVFVPVTLFVGLPIVITSLPENTRRALSNIYASIMNFAFASPARTALSYVLFGVMIMFFVWLFMRRAPLKAPAK